MASRLQKPALLPWTRWIGATTVSVRRYHSKSRCWVRMRNVRGVLLLAAIRVDVPASVHARGHGLLHALPVLHRRARRRSPRLNAECTCAECQRGQRCQKHQSENMQPLLILPVLVTCHPLLDTFLLRATYYTKMKRSGHGISG